jgi:hypothetical protein
VRGRKVALILSGGNIAPDELRQCLELDLDAALAATVPQP